MKTIYDQVQSGERRFVKIEPTYIKRYTENITVTTSLYWENSKHNPEFVSEQKTRFANIPNLPRFILFEITEKGLVEFITQEPIVSHDDMNYGIGVFYENADVIHKIKSVDEFKRTLEDYSEMGIKMFSRTYLEFCKKALTYKQKRDSKIKVLLRKR